MNYKILSFLFSWIFPTKNDRKIFRTLCYGIEERKIIKKIQNNYHNKQKILSQKTKIRVVFLINEISKWKTMSLLETMVNTKIFEPMVVLTIADAQKDLSLKEKADIMHANMLYFQKRNIEVACAYDCKKDRAIPLSKFSPDIIFYQQPYYIPKGQDILETSKYALSCYVPYYLPDYKNLDLDCGYSFHHKLFRFYVFNDSLKNEYVTYVNKQGYSADNIKAVGHTILDLYSKKQGIIPNDIMSNGYVIYAPHWSIPYGKNKNDINISTFIENGEYILEYAKKHPEIKWVFRPHPTLRLALKRSGLWTDAKINQYYKEWENIALCSYDSDYLNIFFASKALITDSGSFLLEYFYTGKPILHLIPQKLAIEPYDFLKTAFDTFYKCYDLNDLSYFLGEVILKDNDFNKNNRNQVLFNNYKVEQIDSSQKIIEDLMLCIKGVAS